MSWRAPTGRYKTAILIANGESAGDKTGAITVCNWAHNFKTFELLRVFRTSTVLQLLLQLLCFAFILCVITMAQISFEDLLKN
jgi:hypothetical protein